MRETIVITGASSGLGIEFAKLYAAEGCRLALVARSEAPMQELAASLKSAHGTECLVLPMDLSAPEAPAALVQALKDRGWDQVDGLVNNAGYGLYGPFHHLDLDKQLNMVSLNVVTLTALCRLFLPGMLMRGRGHILNLASTAAFQPGPGMAVYFASKAYVLSLSQALAEEIRGSGVTVTAVCPGPTVTRFEKTAGLEGSGLFKRVPLMAAVDVARQAHAAARQGRLRLVPGVVNRVIAWMGRHMPVRLVLTAVRRIQQ